MPKLSARLNRAEQATQAKHGNGCMVVWLEDGIYTVDGKTFATLEDVRAEATRRGVEDTVIVEFREAEL